jgi:hypothetical protein
MSTLKEKFIRVTVYLNPQEHRQLKSILALEGITVSEWFRRKIAEKLNTV